MNEEYGYIQYVVLYLIYFLSYNKQFYLQIVQIPILDDYITISKYSRIRIPSMTNLKYWVTFYLTCRIVIVCYNINNSKQNEIYREFSI